MNDVRAMLDDLMGKDRNLGPSDRQKTTIHYTDPSICKHFLCGFCPDQLFASTKTDLHVSPCSKVHDKACQMELRFFLAYYEPSERRYYEEEFYHYLDRLVQDLDRKMIRSQQRIDEDLKQLPPLTDEEKAELQVLNTQLNDTYDIMEQLGSDGNVEQARLLMFTSIGELLRKKDVLLKKPTGGLMKGGMKVCEVCGALLVIGDTEQRTMSHLEGRLHLGCLRIREWLFDYKKRRIEKPPPNESSQRDRDRESRDRDRDQNRDRDSRRSHSSRRYYDDERSSHRRGHRSSYRESRRRHSRSRSRSRSTSREHRRSKRID